MKKPLAFLYAKNEQPENEIKETIPFTIATRAGDMVQVVESLLSKQEALSSNTSNIKKRKLITGWCSGLSGRAPA
jgi:hypothetical protein